MAPPSNARRALRVVALSLLAAGACRSEDLVVATDAGPVRGAADAGGGAAVHRFSRVPYAAPPTGDRRWRPPAPAAPWSEPLDASRAMPACPQDLHLQAEYIHAVGASIGAGESRYAEGLETSEDCLYLSVWAPADRGARHPVLVWLHGGSNVHGWAGDPFFDGAALARRGLVVVVANYRLGALGFLTHPALAAESPRGASGNYGLLDQLAALAWVRRNIGAFGGDSARITAAGQSAGATDVACLLTSPLAEGLMHRAILQSGACLTPWLDARRVAAGASAADSVGIALARALGAGDDARGLATLRRLPPDSLRLAAERLRLAFDPVVDGWVFPDQPMARVERGELLRVPVVVGSNADEASSLVPPGFPPDSGVLRRVLARDFGPDADRALALYPVGDAGARRALVALRTDEWLGEPARATAALVAAAGAPAYLYRLARGAPRSPPRGAYGAFHGAELPLLFGTDPEGWPYVAEEAALGRTIQDYWIAFAATGDPNGAGRPAWPRYDAGAPRLLELDRTPRARSAVDARLDWLAARRRRMAAR